MDTLSRDIRYAVRALLNSPSFSVAVVLTLVLGIGASVAIFSAVRGVLLRPLPFREPAALVSVWPGAGLTGGGFLTYAEGAHEVADVAGIGFDEDLNLTGLGEPLRVRVAAATPNLFTTLGATAALGRVFTPGEDVPGKNMIVLLSDRLWRRRFAADRRVIGQTIELNGVSRTVIGVMPPDFRLPTRETELWLPVLLDRSDHMALWSTNALQVIGRLRLGHTLAQAQAEARRVLSTDVRNGFPWSMPATYGRDATVVPLTRAIVGDFRTPLLVLFGAVVFVLLITCANIANLMLIRSTKRERELSVRSALGASRGRLVSQLLTESVVLAIAGGVGGVLLASLGVRFASNMLPSKTPRVDDIRIDASILLFAVALAILTGLLFGLVPALRASRNDLQGMLRAGGRGTAGSHRRMSSGLVVSEVGFGVLLAVGAALLIRSYWNLINTSPGFQSENLVTAALSPLTSRYSTDDSRRALYDEVLARISSLPDVRGAAIASQVPFAPGGNGSAFQIDGRPIAAGDWPWAEARSAVSPDYFRVIGDRYRGGARQVPGASDSG